MSGAAAPDSRCLTCRFRDDVLSCASCTAQGRALVCMSSTHRRNAHRAARSRAAGCDWTPGRPAQCKVPRHLTDVPVKIDIGDSPAGSQLAGVFHPNCPGATRSSPPSRPTSRCRPRPLWQPRLPSSPPCRTNSFTGGFLRGDGGCQALSPLVPFFGGLALRAFQHRQVAARHQLSQQTLALQPEQAAPHSACQAVHGGGDIVLSDPCQRASTAISTHGIYAAMRQYRRRLEFRLNAVPVHTRIRSTTASSQT